MNTTRLSAALATALLCTVAHADNKLFPTDLLAPRQADAQLSTVGAQSAADVRAGGTHGGFNSYDLGWTAAARYGITHALTVGAGLSGGATNAITQLDNGWRDDTRNTGLRATTLFARLATTPPGSAPYTVTTDLAVAHDNNHHGNTSFNVYSVGGTLSAPTTDLVRTYVNAGLSVPSKGYAHRKLSVSAGGWMLVNPGVTATAEVGLQRVMASSTSTGYNLSAITLGLISEIDNRTSVRGQVGFARTTASGNSARTVSLEPGHAQSLGLALYHLY